MQRPLFLHFEDDARTYAVQDAYLYGPDLLVAPVWHAGGPSGAPICRRGRVGPCVVRPDIPGRAGRHGAGTLRRAAGLLPGRVRISRDCSQA